MFLLVLLASAVSAYRNPVSASPPCGFETPNKENFKAVCGGRYLNTPFMCDPQGIVSFTEAQRVDDSLIAANFSSCFCESTKTCERVDGAPTVVIVAASRVQLIAMRGKRELAPKPRHAATPRPPYACEYIGAPTPEVATKYFADAIRSAWNRVNKCQTDILILVLYSGELVNDDDETSTVQVVVVSYDNATVQSGVEPFYFDFHGSRDRKAKDAFAMIDNIIRSINSTTTPPEKWTHRNCVIVKKNCPLWAALTMLGCGVGALVLAFIGHLVAQSESRFRGRNRLAVADVGKQWKVKFSYETRSAATTSAFSQPRKGLLFVRR